MTENIKNLQRILVFQQNQSAEGKIKAIRKYAQNLIELVLVSIDGPLATVIDDTRSYLPDHIQADLVLDFLKHPDLSHDLAVKCRERRIPVVASGKKHRLQGVFTPPT